MNIVQIVQWSIKTGSSFSSCENGVENRSSCEGGLRVLNPFSVGLGQVLAAHSSGGGGDSDSFLAKIYCEIIKSCKGLSSIKLYGKTSCVEEGNLFTLETCLAGAHL